MAHAVLACPREDMRPTNVSVLAVGWLPRGARTDVPIEGQPNAGAHRDSSGRAGHDLLRLTPATSTSCEQRCDLISTNVGASRFNGDRYPSIRRS